jgi:hypothetical protein
LRRRVELSAVTVMAGRRRLGVERAKGYENLERRLHRHLVSDRC